MRAFFFVYAYRVETVAIRIRMRCLNVNYYFFAHVKKKSFSNSRSLLPEPIKSYVKFKCLNDFQRLSQMSGRQTVLANKYV